MMKQAARLLHKPGILPNPIYYTQLCAQVKASSRGGFRSETKAKINPKTAMANFAKERAQ
jgi:hypothetical protein